MKRDYSYATYLISTVFVLVCVSVAQVATGTPPFSSLGGGPFDVVNLGNLNVHFAVPVLHKAGRGTPFTYDLSYDSSVWRLVTSGGVTVWQPAGNWGWRGSTEAALGYVVQTSRIIACTWLDVRTWRTSYITHWYTQGYSDQFGAFHPMYVATDNGTQPESDYCPVGIDSGTASASDGSGYSISVTLGTPTVTAISGKVINPPLTPTGAAGTSTDANGNKLSVNNGVFTDTLGTTALTVSGSNPIAFAYTPPSGTSVSFKMNYGTYNVKTNFGCNGIADYTLNGALLVSSISLPDGTSYSFTYEATQGSSGYVTGRLASVTLPTGGIVSYSYPLANSGTANGINCADGSAPAASGTNPSMTRTVSTGGQWTYARTQVSGNHWQTKVSTPPDSQNPGSASDDTVIDFQEDAVTGNAATHNFYETQRQAYQGSQSGGTLLLTTETCYNYNYTYSTCPTTAVSSPITNRNVELQYPNSGPQSQTRTYYNFGLVSELDQYAYGSGSPGSLIRKTMTSFGSWNGSSCVALGNSIVVPCQITVQDNGANIKASTRYTYDEGTPAGLTGTPSHTSITGSRGNLTTVATQVSSTVTLYRKMTYYDTGNVHTASDAATTSAGGSNLTTYNYPDATSTCGNAFPGSISEPALSTSPSFTWDCVGGVMKSATDENGQVSTVYYTGTNFQKSADPYFWRPYAVTDQAGNPTTFSYPSATAAESTMAFNNSNSVVDHRTTVDGFGRPIVSQTEQGYNSGHYDSAETDYDAMGRVSKMTQPYSGTAGATCSGTCPGTTTTYEALGRPRTVTDGGSGTITYTYTANDVYQEMGPAPSGENTKKKQLEYDALGHLISVCEITSGSGSGTCSQTSTQTGFWTQYTYNLLGNMTVVTQNSQAASGSQQTRTYTFDEIGRLTSEANPETGTVNYTYDSSDTTCSSYASAGDLVEKKDAMSNYTCFKYDGLHRVTQITYPSGTYASSTPTKCFVYDSATVNGNSMQNAKNRLAEAYTTTATSCTGTPTVDEGFSYSARGEVTDVWEKTPNSNGYYHVTSQYWANGTMNTLSGLPGLPTITYGASDGSGLDGEGRITKVMAASGQNPVTCSTSPCVSYNVGGQVTGLTFGSGDSDAYQYDGNTGRMNKYTFNLGTGPQTQIGQLTWNTNGTLQKLQITDQINTGNSQTCTFGYDDLVRITSANCGSVWAQTFAFDPFGNLNKSGSASFTPTYTGTSGTSTTPSNQYYSISGGPSGTSNYYDVNGNLKNDITHTYTWDADGNNLGVDGSTVTLIYDAMDRMVEQTRGASHSQIVYGPYGMKLALMNGQTFVNAFVKLPGGARAVYSSSGLAYYRHADHLGSSRLSTTTSRTKYYDVAYAPYGEDYDGSGTLDLAFTDQNQDTAGSGWSGNLYDFLLREYRTAHGRWTSPDPGGLSVADPMNPQRWNRYGYVLNNPLNLVDPLGLEDDCGGVCTPFWLDLGNGCYQFITYYQVTDDTGTWDMPDFGPISCGSGRYGYGYGGQGGQLRARTKPGFTLGIRAPGQSYSQCLGANSGNYSIYNWLPSSAQNGATKFALGNDVSNALFGDANEGTAGLVVGAGVGAAPLGVGTAGTFGRRTASIFNLNLSGTTGPAPTILGKTGAAEVVGWVSGVFELKLAIDIGATAAEALNCIGHR